MTEYCVIVTDAVRARFFTLDESKLPEVESGPRLVEYKTLLNPEKEMPGREIFEAATTVRSRTTQGGAAHGYDDHRSQHEQEFERRFARHVADETTTMVKTRRPRCIVLAAEPRMLGIMRREMGDTTKTGVEFREKASNLTKLSALEIQEHLAKDQLVPACRRPASRG